MSKDKIPGGNGLLNPQDILENQLKLNYGARVADLGCGGIGYFTFQAAEIVGQTGQVYAVDILKNVLKNIDHRAKMLGMGNIKTIWSNLENYGGAKINDSAVDYAFLVTVLFQNEHSEKILREAVRILIPAGKLLIIDWKQGRFPFGPSIDKRISPAQVIDVALGAGLKKIKEFEAGKFHYGIIFEKI